MRHLKLTVAYDGASYVGWQVQKNGVSVQEKLEAAWEQITGETIRITASGRTDSGVHARAQVCGLVTQSQLTCERLAFALTAETPLDITVFQIEEAPEGFDPIRHCSRKTYRYQIQFGAYLDVIARQYRWYVPRRLDIFAMREAAELIKGKHDFACFQAKGSERLTTTRHITRLDVDHFRSSPYDYVDIVVTSDGFLYNMVRNIVGTLVRIGVGKEPVEWAQLVLDSRNREMAGETAPAHGLFLESVEYDD